MCARARARARTCGNFSFSARNSSKLKHPSRSVSNMASALRALENNRFSCSSATSSCSSSCARGDERVRADKGRRTHRGAHRVDLCALSVRRARRGGEEAARRPLTAILVLVENEEADWGGGAPDERSTDSAPRLLTLEHVLFAKRAVRGQRAHELGVVQHARRVHVCAGAPAPRRQQARGVASPALRREQQDAPMSEKM